MNIRGMFKKISLATDERGAVLITGLLLVLVLTILSLAAMMSTATELKIASNDRSAKQVFYVAEAGLEDTRSRMQTAASASPIYDDQAINPNWTAFVGTAAEAAAKGYSGSSDQARYDRLNSSLDYVVTITHKLDSSGRILKWGESNGDGVPEENTSVGTNIFVITSEGYTTTGASKPIRIEATRVPSIPAPAALYTKEHTMIQGTSVSILGMDHCGTDDVPGVLTMAGVGQNGHPTITGSSEGKPAAIVEHSPKNIDVQALIVQFRGKANYNYNVNSATLAGMDWGTPNPGATQQDASSCNARNVVYFNTNNTYVKLAGQSHGCGILLVDGDLAIQGGFQWHGVILATGSITFTGGGGKNVTGAMMAGATVSADLVGGDSTIVYCSRAVNDQTNSLPLITLRWLELFS
jgi:Tfp pilus assembly protein PilX